VFLAAQPPREPIRGGFGDIICGGGRYVGEIAASAAPVGKAAAAVAAGTFSDAESKGTWYTDGFMVVGLAIEVEAVAHAWVPLSAEIPEE
jgi:hypothetical protein